MADALTVRTVQNGYRNVWLQINDVSDGSGLAAHKIYDATSSGAFGVTQAGQTFYPGIHTTIVTLDYDVQDMKIQLLWEASANEPILTLGAAPEDFKWLDRGGIPCPPGLAGATGSILLTTIGAVANATCWLMLGLRKNVPQS